MKDTAIQVLQRLANGVNPVTGEILSAESPFNEPVVMRSLSYALGRLEARERSPRTDLPENHGRPWVEDERQFAINAFKEGAEIAPIAKTLKRSNSAIRAELMRQGLIQPDRVNPAPAGTSAAGASVQGAPL